MKIAVYDNDGKTFDRYTVIIGNDVYGMSHNPKHPQGFNQFCGQLFIDFNESTLIEVSGRETQVQDLPRAVISAIVDRIKDYEIAD